MAATLGCILPSCIIVTAIARLYLKYRKMDMIQGVLAALRPAVVGMIAAAGLSILATAFWGSAGQAILEKTDWDMVFIFVGGFILLKKFRWNPVLVMALAGGAKVAVTALEGAL